MAEDAVEMDVDHSGDEGNLSEEDKQLVAMAIRFRSRATFEKSLEQLCVDCILDNATLLHSSPQTRLEYAEKFPAHVFGRRLLGQMEHRVKLIDDEMTHPRRLQSAASLAQLLLNESVTEFDFKVFGSAKRTWQNESWRLLTEKCPRLSRVVDESWNGHYDYPGRRKFVRLAVLPHLLKLTKLEHIVLQHHLCSSKDLAKLVEAFPDLQSLCLSVQLGVDYSLILGLKKLERLSISFTILTNKDSCGRTDIDKNFLQGVLDDFIRRLPRLKEATVANACRLYQIKTAHHNSQFEVLEQPLALRTLYVKEGFNGWTSDKLPHATKLILEHSLRNVDEFLGFRNLVVLDLDDIDGDDIEKILMQGQHRLESLKLGSTVVDPYLIFHFCPNLRVIHFTYEFCPKLGRSDLYPLRAENFEKLRKVHLEHDMDETFPSDVLMQILQVPLLEDLCVLNFLLELEHLELLLELLHDRRILQHLTKCTLDVFKLLFNYEEFQDLLFELFKLLPCYAPRLQKLVCNETEEIIKDFEEDQRFKMFELPEFYFEYSCK